MDEEQLRKLEELNAELRSLLHWTNHILTAINNMHDALYSAHKILAEIIDENTPK